MQQRVQIGDGLLLGGAFHVRFRLRVDARGRILAGRTTFCAKRARVARDLFRGVRQSKRIGYHAPRRRSVGPVAGVVGGAGADDAVELLLDDAHRGDFAGERERLAFRRGDDLDGLGGEDVARRHVGVGKLEGAHVVQQRAEAVHVDGGVVAHVVERPAEHARRAEADGGQLAVLPERGGDQGAACADGLAPIDQHGALHLACAGHRQNDVGGADVAVHHAAIACVDGVDDVKRRAEDGVGLVEGAGVSRKHPRRQRLLDGEALDVLHGDGVMGQPLLVGARSQGEGHGRMTLGACQLAQALELAQRRLAVGVVILAVAVVAMEALDGHGRAVVSGRAHQLGEAAGFGVVGKDLPREAEIRGVRGELRCGEGDRACHDGHLFGVGADGRRGEGERAGPAPGCGVSRRRSRSAPSGRARARARRGRRSPRRSQAVARGRGSRLRGRTG